MVWVEDDFSDFQAKTYAFYQYTLHKHCNPSFNFTKRTKARKHF